MGKTTDALIIIDRMIGHDVEMRRLIAEAKVTGDIAQAIYDARLQATLTREELGRLAKVKASVIARIESADSSDLPIAQLHRVAHALGLDLAVKLHPRDRRGGSS